MIYQILSLLIWGSSFIAAKYTYEMLDAALMVEARLLIAALMVLPSCRRHLGNQQSRLNHQRRVEHLVGILGSDKRAAPD